MYVLSSRDSLVDADGEVDGVEADEAEEGEAAGERLGVAGLATRSAGEAVGEAAGCTTTWGATGLRISHISHVVRLTALW